MKKHGSSLPQASSQQRWAETVVHPLSMHPPAPGGITSCMGKSTVLRLQDGFGLDHLHLEAEEVPSPGFGEVHVRFHAASLNYRDLLTVLGQYNPRMELPRIPGSDAAGEVVTVGAGVHDLKPGDRVTSLFFQNWQAGEITSATGKSALGGSIDGVFATDRVLPASGVIRMPPQLSFAQAATLPCAALTAWNALVERGRLCAGQTVLTLGTGGVSLFGLQIAKAHGARVIVTSSSDEKLARARELGADETINYQVRPEWAEEVLRLTDKRGVDHVLEVGGAGTLPQSLQAVRAGGHVHVIGVLSGPGQGPDIRSMLMKSLHVNGIIVGSREMFLRLNLALETNHIQPVIDRVFPLAEAHTALEHMQKGSHFGKIVLDLRM